MGNVQSGTNLLLKTSTSNNISLAATLFNFKMIVDFTNLITFAS